MIDAGLACYPPRISCLFSRQKVDIRAKTIIEGELEPELTLGFPPGRIKILWKSKYRQWLHLGTYIYLNPRLLIIGY
jgi:hypothetical protein